MAPKTISLSVDERTVAMANAIATHLEIPKSRVWDAAILMLNGSILAATEDLNRVASGLAKEFGEDARVTIWVEPDPNGAPAAFMTVDGKPFNGGAVAVPTGKDTVRLFLTAPPASQFLAEVTEQGVMRMFSRFALGELPWPPRGGQALTFRVRDLTGVVEQQQPLANIPVEASA
jgi:hypothetical protein